MKILFGILTCEKYLSTRCEWIKNTWLENLEDDNYYFISSKKISDRIIGFNTLDSYESVPYKILEYIKYIYENELDNYDWFHFSDDDCFINIKNLKKVLINYMVDDECVVCRKAELNNEQCNTYNIRENKYYPGGGASYSMNRTAIIKLYNYIINEKNIPIHRNGDISKGVWLNKSSVYNLIHSELLGFTTPMELRHDLNTIKQNVSYHYCDKDMFYFLKNNI
jgi:hypothetical protein